MNREHRDHAPRGKAALRGDTDLPSSTGTLYGIGLGPGDPDLVTVRAARLLASARIVAYYQARPGSSIARRIAADYLPTTVEDIALEYPATTGAPKDGTSYRDAMNAFYADSAERLKTHLDAGHDVHVIGEGDPMLYGSYQHLHRRLSDTYRCVVVPGVTSFSAAAAELGTPLVEHTQVLTIMPGTLPHAQLVQHLTRTDGAIIMKLGRNAPAVNEALHDATKHHTTWYAERVGHPSQRLARWNDIDHATVPYMALAVSPAPAPAYTPNVIDVTDTPADVPESAPAPAPATNTGDVVVVGLGPGPDTWRTPAATQALAEADDLVGYATYLGWAPEHAGQQRHASDNTDEAHRARHALRLAEQGRRVAVVSSGDPGVFAMATAVLEAAEDPQFAHIPVRVEPGVSAAQAAAARAGAPLGHDFATISLSDRLKPLDVVLDRLRACARAGLAIAIYNPASRSRTTQFATARDALAEILPGDTTVVVARSVGRPGENITITTLDELDPTTITMAHLVIIGTTSTHVHELPDGTRRTWTSRRHEPATAG